MTDAAQGTQGAHSSGVSWLRDVLHDAPEEGGCPPLPTGSMQTLPTGSLQTLPTGSLREQPEQPEQPAGSELGLSFLNASFLNGSFIDNGSYLDGLLEQADTVPDRCADTAGPPPVP